MTDLLQVMLVEDDEGIRITVRDTLEDAGFSVACYADGLEACEVIERQTIDILITDIRLPGVDGITLFRRCRGLQPHAGVILMTAFGRIEDAVTVMREGADDYITKPFEIDELRLRVERLAERLLLRRALASSGETAAADLADLLVCRSPAMRRVCEQLHAAHGTPVAVLLRGETGTGKELCAQTIHARSARASKPFIHINCAAIPGELFESEFFGHARGAFSGAVVSRKGRVVSAEGGTLFLDEIGELSAEHQPKLLRLLDSGEFEPVGGDSPHRADVRILSATNRDLEAEVRAGTFRQDLLFRLRVLEVVVPPLRERRADLPELIGSCLLQITKRFSCQPPTLSPRAMAGLLSYDYPGNVRELIHALEHGVALTRGQEIDLQHLPPVFHRPGADGDEVPGEGGPLPLAEAIAQFEQVYIARTLQDTEGKRIDAARRLGISRKSLWKKLKQQ